MKTAPKVVSNANSSIKRLAVSDHVACSPRQQGIDADHGCKAWPSGWTVSRQERNEISRIGA
jgi:hypothetical protein